LEIDTERDARSRLTSGCDYSAREIRRALAPDSTARPIISAALREQAADRQEAAEGLIARRHDQQRCDHSEETEDGDFGELGAARGPERIICRAKNAPDPQ
jgi:hypothetical protein